MGGVVYNILTLVRTYASCPIRMLHQKPADLDLHLLEKKKLCAAAWWANFAVTFLFLLKVLEY